jgi:hypothetical protein
LPRAVNNRMLQDQRLGEILLPYSQSENRQRCKEDIEKSTEITLVKSTAPARYSDVKYLRHRKNNILVERIVD